MEAIKLEESVQARFKHAPELVATFRNVGEAGDFPDKMCWFVYSSEAERFHLELVEGALQHAPRDEARRAGARLWCDASVPWWLPHRPTVCRRTARGMDNLCVTPGLLFFAHPYPLPRTLLLATSRSPGLYRRWRRTALRSSSTSPNPMLVRLHSSAIEGLSSMNACECTRGFPLAENRVRCSRSHRRRTGRVEEYDGQIEGQYHGHACDGSNNTIQSPHIH